MSAYGDQDTNLGVTVLHYPGMRGQRTIGAIYVKQDQNQKFGSLDLLHPRC